MTSAPRPLSTSAGVLTATTLADGSLLPPPLASCGDQAMGSVAIGDQTMGNVATRFPPLRLPSALHDTVRAVQATGTRQAMDAANPPQLRFPQPLGDQAMGRPEVTMSSTPPAGRDHVVRSVQTTVTRSADVDAATSPRSAPRDSAYSVASSDDEDQDKGKDGHSVPEGEGVAPDFLQLSQFIFDQFSDSRGAAVHRKRSAGPGEEDFVVSKPSNEFVPFKWSRPMSEALDWTHELLSDRVGKGQSALLPYTARRKRRFYEVSDDATRGRSLVVNPAIGQCSSPKVYDTPARVATADLSRMEEAMRSIREIQNFQFWVFGAFTRLVKLQEQVPNRDLLMAKTVDSMQRAMKDAAKESSLVLSNLVSLRRDTVLRGLPSSFSMADKMALRHSALDSQFLFDEHRLSEVLANAEKVTSRSFQEAAAEALKKKKTSPAISPLLSHPAAKPSSSGLPGHPKKSFPRMVQKPPQPGPSRPSSRGRGKLGFRK